MKRQILLFAIFGSLVFPTLVHTQEPQQQSAPPASPVFSSGLSIDSQGVKNYLLGPGDVVDVRVFGQSDLNAMAEVDSDGNISSLPFLEKPIVAKCRTEKQIQADIAAAYSKYIKNPQISVRTTERKSRPPAIVSGAVRQPTRVVMMRKVRLNEILVSAGGFTDRASGTIQIVHTEPLMCPQPGEEAEAAPIDSSKEVPLEIVKVSDLRAGNAKANPVIRPGDFILVTEAEPVYITGSVVYPQGIYLTDQLTLSRALAQAGGVRKEGKSDDIRIYRQKPGAEQEVIRANFKAIQNLKEPDVKLKAYDVIDVPEAGLFSSQRIVPTLLGAVTGGLGSMMSSAGSSAFRTTTIR
ncbi:MAG TPA: polysaccharide biosynthesis/export family protein [Pyrinomonadaceae bacterium]|nr:polysaccharide biosynthesis/export family protein [Pyrinomonadaceae bacterium]